MKRTALVRRAALSAMALVTAWSIWAWAQPQPPPPHPGAAPRPPHHMLKPVHEPEGAADAKEGAEAEEGEGPAPMTWTEFGGKTPPYAAMLINFVVLVAAYYLLGKKGVTEGLKSRRDTIAKDIEEAQRMKHEAEARAKLYQSKLEHLETELAETKVALQEAGKSERDRIVKDAEEKAVRMQKDAAFMLEQESKQLRIDLQREAVLVALTAAEDVLRKRVTAADQDRLAEEFLASLEQRETFGASGAVANKAGRP